MDLRKHDREIRWAQMWAERCATSSFAQQAVYYGIATHEELEFLANEWRAWAEDPDAVFIVLHGKLFDRF